MIVQTRQLAADMLKGLDYPVLSYPPLDVETLPCVVVGMPTVEPAVPGPEAGTASLMASLPLMCIGRPLRDIDSLAQMDAMADEVVDRFVAGYRLSVVAETASVAGGTYPAYVVLVSIPLGFC